MNNNKRIKNILHLIDSLVNDVSGVQKVDTDLYKKIYNYKKAISTLMFSNGDLEEVFKESIPASILGNFEANVRGQFYHNIHICENAPNSMGIYSEIESTIKTYCKYKNLKVFYSWQSNSPNNTNRSFIQDSIQKAIKQINDEKEIQMYIDSDTRGECGSPDIVATILRKIDESQVFICDVTSIGNIGHKEIPNPNVVFELGYALKCLGESKIIMIYNLAFGKISDLPFDLNQKRIMTYNCPAELEVKSEVKKQLIISLKAAIELILESY